MLRYMTAFGVSIYKKVEVILTYSAFNEDVLASCAGSSNTIDAGLVQGSNKSVGRLVMEFVVAVKDNIVVGGKFSSHILPEGLEV